MLFFGGGVQIFGEFFRLMTSDDGDGDGDDDDDDDDDEEGDPRKEAFLRDL